ncbi:uncharacterized protein LOC135713814, partial [Ochlerotatus camptorhynchus]|uniref:uncharacterized protein LOC135713814 n=1 Tax=Ochlerotatus camptorhynchus TaxID=644619 RepID=UPI0031DBCC04
MNNRDVNITGFSCARCNAPDDADTGMVGCDNCSQWFHFECVGVSAEVKNVSWSCSDCKDKCAVGNDAENEEKAVEISDQNTEEGENAEDGGGCMPAADPNEALYSSVEELERELLQLEETRKLQRRKMELEKLVHRRRLEAQQELAEQRQEMEREKRQMELEIERAHLEKAIAAEEAYRKEQQEMRNQLDGKLQKMRQTRQDADRVKAICAPKKSSVHKVATGGDKGLAKGQSDYRGAYSKHSTPKNVGKNPTFVDTVNDPTPSKVVEGYAESEADTDAESEANSESEAESKVESNVESEDEELGEPTNSQIQRFPTKAQLSARQFIARKLPVFTGRPEDWPMFISSFETANEACGFSNIENLARLQESLKGPALEAVRSRLFLPNAVPQVIESLRMLYGRPEQLLNTLLAKVRKAESPKADRLASFIGFGMVVQQLVDHLEATNLRDHLINPMLIQELVEKLPAGTKMEWVRHKRQAKCVSLRTLSNFLAEIVRDASEATVFNDVPPPQDNRTNKKGKNNRSKEYEGFVHTHGAETKTGGIKQPVEPRRESRTPCPMCARTDHRVRNCAEFRKLSVVERLEAVDDWELCRICLNDHGKSTCKLNIVCKVENCGQRHNTLLHQPRVVLRSDCNTHSQIGLCQPVIFRMVAVTLYHGHRAINILAFLDEGSSYTLVESSLTNQLKVKGQTQPLRVTWTAGMTRLERDSQRLQLTLSARGSKERFQIQNVHTVQSLNLPRQALRYADVASQYPHLQNLPVVDYTMEPPKILIGLKHIHLFAPLESRVGKPEEPIAVRSKLGWTVYGPQEQQDISTPYVGHHSCAGVSNQELHDILRSHYALEDAGVSVDLLPESSEDQRARQIMESTTVRIGESGERFQTGLLWKEDDPQFPNSYPMAQRRMKLLEKRLSKNPELMENVRTQLVEYQRKGYCHKATKEELGTADPKKVWYLPLNVVLNPKKPGKVRLVWDAAATVQGVSLNSQLLKGPDYLTSLPSVICQFREYLVGFGGDIREMFHQLKIRPEDRQALRFIFCGQVYVMDCAIFGATCSPSQAMYVKDRNAKEWESEFPEAATAIVKKHYVDDYFDSAQIIEEAVQRASDVRYVHSKAGFEIRNWVSNSVAVLQQLGETQVSQAVHFNRDKATDTERVLGIIWSPSEDVFAFSTKMRDDLLPYLFEGKRPTKRVVLSCVMSLFDPLGLLAPFTIYGRVLIQNLWRTGCEWDDPIDDDSVQKWITWTSYLSAVEAVKIPRYHFGDGVALEYDSLQLHIFTDASECAYGCVAYFRILAGGVPRCSLVQAKSKVAPLKPNTIPRLELMAAVLGARMVSTIKESHNLEIKKVFLWTDSRTVHSWIVSDLWKYRIFTALRVGDILNRTMASDWHWVPTRLNVADEVTKWNKGPQLGSDSRWFNGPGFLYQSEEEWPAQPVVKPNTKEELRATFLFHDLDLPERLIDVSRVSKWNVLVRTLACVLRFVGNIRKKQQGKQIETLPTASQMRGLVRRMVPAKEQPLTHKEFQEAERLLWKMAQAERFAAEIRILRQKPAGTSLPKADKDSDLYKLSPVVDEFGILRHEGRTKEADFLPFELRFPIILPRGHPITIRLLEYYHQRFGHANRETVTNELRQRFYIPYMRAQLKKVMRECMWCKVHKCRPRIPRMAPLPVQRLTPNLRPFSFSGVDYFGPITVTVGRRTEKRWVSLFTCLTTRAVHLEVTHSLSTQSCVMAIRRFACRRGMPIEFFSDNGTNFVGASKEVTRSINTECCDTFTDARTRWSFNPPSAPHMGGVWERLVRSVKEAMKVFDDGRKLTDEILLTTLAEAEDLINTRPLTYVPQESAEVEALTPNHFIRGLPSTGGDTWKPTTGEAEALRDTYKRSQRLADKLWKRWLEEYLPSINLRSKWHADSEPLMQGEVVYLADGNNRKSWVRGMVQELIRSSDGRIRQAIVRT